MLDKQMLEMMSPRTIFATGIVDNSPDGIFMSREGGKLRWVAISGHNHDWAIYIHHAESSADFVRRHGDKVSFADHIRKLVPCDDEAFKKYRY